MKSRWFVVLASGLLAAPLVPQDKDEKAAKTEGSPAKTAPAKEITKEDLKTTKDKASYVIGFIIGKDLRSKGIDPDLGLCVKGIQDAVTRGKPLLAEAEIQAVMQEFQKEMSMKQQERSEKCKKDGEAFLAENKSKPGVETLPSGLQYKVIEPGAGPKPKATDTVTTHYRGTLIDGTEFDSSYSRGEPATFQVRGVIKGWTEALQLMPVGAKWQLYIPSTLAYGERGAGGDIGPHSTLIFEIQLISIAEAK